MIYRIFFNILDSEQNQILKKYSDSKNISLSLNCQFYYCN